MLSLPIDAFLAQIVEHTRRARAVVVTAEPGAGKTTRVPPALVEDGPVVLLQPRRVAARAIASRIAEERGWTIGRQVGWQVRFERRFGPETRLLAVTDGVLTARLQANPLLSQFRTVVIDEFHERSVQADLALTLSKQAWRARADLRIVVMSATLETAAVSAFLDGCPVVEVPGRVHPIDVTYKAGQSVADGASELLAATGGDVLCFLPGAPEIRRAMADLERPLGGAAVNLVPLHGSLDALQQDLALRPGPRRRVVVATNIAETSITVPGVTGVVDSGLHKVARYDAARAIDTLDLERITADAADQRAGRAGRVGPGMVRRLWDATDRLRPHREPEIRRIDLSAAVLDVVGWGGDPRTLDWFEPPRKDLLGASLALLERLGLIARPPPGGRAPTLTALGEQVRRLPVHPRLASMLVAARGAHEMVQACAVLSERHLLPPRAASTSSDLLAAIDSWSSMPAHVHRVAHELEKAVEYLFRDRGEAIGVRGPWSELDFRRAVLAGYPDRVAQRREPRSARLRLASGAGAKLGAESGVTESEFLVAVDVQFPASQGPGGRAGRRDNEAIVRLASTVEREWLEPSRSDVVHRFDGDSRTVKAALVERYDELVLTERAVPPDPAAAADLLAAEWIRRGPSDSDRQFFRRLRFAGHEPDVDGLVRLAARDAQSLDEMRLARGLPPQVSRSLDRDAPETVDVPSGRSVRLEYAEDGGVCASVKLQELFGLAETPRIGPHRQPVVLALLAPNGRPVQLTSDLRSFWDRTYPEVRKALRGRYPKHPWPDDPWKATPTERARKRGSPSSR